MSTFINLSLCCTMETMHELAPPSTAAVVRVYWVSLRACLCLFTHLCAREFISHNHIHYINVTYSVTCHFKLSSNSKWQSPGDKRNEKREREGCSMTKRNRHPTSFSEFYACTQWNTALFFKRDDHQCTYISINHLLHKRCRTLNGTQGKERQ